MENVIDESHSASLYDFCRTMDYPKNGKRLDVLKVCLQRSKYKRWSKLQQRSLDEWVSWMSYAP